MESRDVAQKKSRLIKRVALPLALGLAGLGLLGSNLGHTEPKQDKEAPAAAVVNVVAVKAGGAIKVGGGGAQAQAGIRW